LAVFADLSIFGRVPLHGLDDAARLPGRFVCMVRGAETLGLGDEAGAAVVCEAVDAVDSLGEFGDGHTLERVS
jgi:hypothetical protein